MSKYCYDHHHFLTVFHKISQLKLLWLYNAQNIPKIQAVLVISVYGVPTCNKVDSAITVDFGLVQLYYSRTTGCAS